MTRTAARRALPTDPRAGGGAFEAARRRGQQRHGLENPSLSSPSETDSDLGDETAKLDGESKATAAAAATAAGGRSAAARISVASLVAAA